VPGGAGPFSVQSRFLRGGRDGGDGVGEAVTAPAASSYAFSTVSTAQCMANVSDARSSA
jgi:hypothetical protein